MDTPLDLDKLTRQTQQREYLDGLRDLHLGFIILILSLLNWFILSPAGATLLVKSTLFDKNLTAIGLIGVLALFVLITFGSEKLIERIRRASLWRESGFVKPLRFGFNKWLILGSTVALLAIIIGSVWFMALGRLAQEVALRSIPASASLATGILLFGMGYSLKIRRYLAVAVAGTLLAIAIFLYPLAFGQAWLWLGIGWAAILLVSGTWAFWLALSELKRGISDE
jgi:hypothetical protein